MSYKVNITVSVLNSVAGLAFGQKFTDEEKFDVSRSRCAVERVSRNDMFDLQDTDPFKLKTGGLVDMKDVTPSDLEG